MYSDMTAATPFTQQDVQRLLSHIDKLQDNVEDLVKENYLLAKENDRLVQAASNTNEQKEQSRRDLEQANERIEELEASLLKVQQGSQLYLPFTAPEFDTMLTELEIIFDNTQHVKTAILHDDGASVLPVLNENLINLENVHKKLRTVDDACPNIGSDIGYRDLLHREVLQGEVMEVIPPRLRLRTDQGPRTIHWTSVVVGPDVDGLRCLFNRPSAESSDSEME